MNTGLALASLRWAGLGLLACGCLLVLRRLGIALVTRCLLTGKSGATMLIEEMKKSRTVSTRPIGRMPASSNSSGETLDASNGTAPQNSKWGTKWRGVARVASLSLMLSLVIVGGVSGGISGAWVQTKTQSKPSPVVAKQDQYFTIGCTEKDIANCKLSELITVIDVVGDRYHLEHDFKSELKPDWWMKHCPGTPRFPFNRGDKFYFLKYAEDYENQCQFLGDHWGWAAVRNSFGMTDSEQEEARYVRR